MAFFFKLYIHHVFVWNWLQSWAYTNHRDATKSFSFAVNRKCEFLCVILLTDGLIYSIIMWPFLRIHFGHSTSCVYIVPVFRGVGGVGWTFQNNTGGLFLTEELAEIWDLEVVSISALILYNTASCWVKTWMRAGGWWQSCLSNRQAIRFLLWRISTDGDTTKKHAISWTMHTLVISWWDQCEWNAENVMRIIP